MPSSSIFSYIFSNEKHILPEKIPSLIKDMPRTILTPTTFSYYIKYLAQRFSQLVAMNKCFLFNPEKPDADSYCRVREKRKNR